MRRASLALLGSWLLAAGCGSSGASPGSGPSGAAQRFIAAITAGERDRWCPQLATSAIGGPAGHRLSGTLLAQCVRHDIFETTGSCDREAAVVESSIDASSFRGTVAEMKLSSGASLTLTRVSGIWLISRITVAPHPKVPSCVGTAPASGPQPPVRAASAGRPELRA